MNIEEKRKEIEGKVITVANRKKIITFAYE